MQYQIHVARELAELLKVVSHPDRIRLVEELRVDEFDVNSLHDRLGLPAARVSQHLAILKAHRLVEERREGRRHFYRLSQPDLARWIVEGMRILENRTLADARTRSAVKTVRRKWTLKTA